MQIRTSSFWLHTIMPLEVWVVQRNEIVCVLLLAEPWLLCQTTGGAGSRTLPHYLKGFAGGWVAGRLAPCARK